MKNIDEVAKKLFKDRADKVWNHEILTCFYNKRINNKENMKNETIKMLGGKQNKRYIFPIILIAMTILVIGLSIFTFLNDKHLKNEIKTLKSEKLILSTDVIAKDSEINTLKKEKDNAIIYGENIRQTGLQVAEFLGGIEELFLRYDDLYIKEHNWIVENVTFQETGVWTMNYYLSEHKKIQDDYAKVLQAMQNEINAKTN